jgi:hypothetical protein
MILGTDHTALQLITHHRCKAETHDFNRSLFGMGIRIADIVVDNFSVFVQRPNWGPAHYFPIRGARYEVAAGLHRLGTAFGNGELDARLFQLDRHWADYRKEKLRARKERLEKYVCQDKLNKTVERALVAHCLDRLPKEYPEYFRLQRSGQGAWILHCSLTGEALHVDKKWTFLHSKPSQRSAQSSGPRYISGMDALACQLQEDLAIIEINDKGEEQLTALHLCYPNHWAAEDKIGCGFAAMHGSVPGFETLARQARPLIKHLLHNGPYVRFAWGLATDTRLNHHPQPPRGIGAQAWQGRAFNPDQPQLYLRIERQVILGLPEAGALLFTIRTYLEDIVNLEDQRKDQLRLAIESMDEATLLYKGIGPCRDDILGWLRSPSNLAPT